MQSTSYLCGGLRTIYGEDGVQNDKNKHDHSSWMSILSLLGLMIDLRFGIMFLIVVLHSGSKMYRIMMIASWIEHPIPSPKIILWRRPAQRMMCLLSRWTGTAKKTRWLPSKSAKRNQPPRWPRTDRRAGFFGADWWQMYIGVLVLPEEESEREERQVVVCSLEAAEAGEDDHGDEELFDVLQHFNS